jgi:two-component system CheB/CheR fusion protein
MKRRGRPGPSTKRARSRQAVASPTDRTGKIPASRPAAPDQLAPPPVARSEASEPSERDDSEPSASSPPPPHPPPFLIAAVGASAGGWSAFSGLLRHLAPTSPMALLLVQHLSPEHKSILPELLENVTTMPVEKARDRLHIEPGHIYVIPPDAVMTVVDGSLRVTSRADSRLADGVGPVDALFRSVAEVYRQHAVGVVLSGSGTDGAAGTALIKEAGGVVLAQTPDEAEIDGMPRAAIATGAVDAVMPVAEIGEQLVRLAGHPFFRREPSELEPELELPSAAGYRRRIFQLLKRAAGVDFNNYKLPTLTRRIQRRMALHRISTLGDYATLIERDARELHRLQADLLIHVTSFFREPDSFLALAQNVLPDMIRNHSDLPFRVWVPGCSTGEETYSLVMVILECLGERTEQMPLQVFSTDVSETTIEQARAGAYPASIAADVSPDRLRRFFTPLNGGYRINKAVRDCCVFARQDVTRDPPFSRLDLIVCRNLLIYLKQPTQRKVMGVFHYALNADGILMLGRSETAGPGADLFTILDKRHQIYSRKAGYARMEIDFTPVSPAEPPLMPTDKPPRPSRSGSNEWDAQTDANRFLLDHYAPPALIIDSASKIVRSRGNTSRYIEIPSGDVTLDVVKMVRPELLFAVRSVVQEAQSSGKAAMRTGVRLTVERQPTLVDLHAVPIGGNSEGRQVMLIFEEPRGGKATGKPAPSRRDREPGGGDGARSSKRMVADLQVELVETRQQLQGIIDDLGAANEELQSANEEVLSSNEELQSTNEELDTAKEELQSTNEELSTLNDELHGRNDELSRVNSDLVNLLGSVQIPIVMVSQDLKIRRFTPAAEKTLNIIPSDVGRPIGHLKPNFVCPDLEALIAQVVDSVTTYDGEVDTTDGRKLAMQIRPYKTVNNQIDGAVLALFEVPAGRLQEAATSMGELEDAFLAVASRPTLLLDGQRRLVKANAAFCKDLGVSLASVRNRALDDLKFVDWNPLELRRLLDERLTADGGFDEIDLATDPSRFGRHCVRVRARRVEGGARTGGTTILSVEDAPPADPHDPPAGHGGPPRA